MTYVQVTESARASLRFCRFCDEGKSLVFKKTHHGIEQICEKYAEKHRAQYRKKLFDISAEVAVIQKEENTQYRKQYHEKRINCDSGIFFIPVNFFQMSAPFLQ